MDRRRRPEEEENGGVACPTPPIAAAATAVAAAAAGVAVFGDPLEHRSAVLQSVCQSIEQHWDRHQRRGMLMGHDARVFQFAFLEANGHNHGGLVIGASASEDGTARMWDVRGRRCLGVVRAHDKDCEVLRVAWHPNRERGLLATASADGTARIWDVRSILRGAQQQQQQQYEQQQQQESSELSFLPPPPQGAKAVKKNAATLFHGAEIAPGVADVSKDPYQVFACEFSCEGGQNTLLTAAENMVYFWDLETQQASKWQFQKMESGNSVGGARNPDDLAYVYDAALSGSILASAVSDGTVRINDTRSGETIFCSMLQEAGHLTSVAWADGASALASTASNGVVCVWDPRTWTCRSVLRGHERCAYGAAFWPGAEGLLLSWSSDQTMCIWDLLRSDASGGDGSAPLARLRQDGYPILSCAIFEGAPGAPGGSGGAGFGSSSILACAGGGGEGFSLGNPVWLHDLALPSSPGEP